MCGVFGIYRNAEAAKLTYLGLHALQHRGQESAGIVSSDGSKLFAHRSMGLVQDVFKTADLERIQGDSAIGHVRYATAGTSHVKNAQPFAVSYARGAIAVGHDGNLINAEDLREKLEDRGSIFQSDSDAEVVVHLVAMSQEPRIEDRIAEALLQVKGAYAFVFLTEEALVAVRDPLGIRPLVLGRMRKGGDEASWVLASEPCAFELMGAKMIREVEPGEMIVVDEQGLRSRFPFASPGQEPTRKACIFEQVYFARPDSKQNGASIYEVRKSFGKRLAQEQPTSCDVVIPVPDSGVPAAIGYAREAGIPFEMGLIRSHYVGRTFIEPEQSIRHFGVKLKLSPIAETLRGKRVVVVDDSIVRGTTSRKIVKMIRDAGAKEVHVRISSPPTTWPCYYGIDTPTRKELIAASHTLDEIRQYITADSLGYLSLEGLLEAACSAPGSEARPQDFCHACFSGEYPVPLASEPSPKRQLSLLDDR